MYERRVQVWIYWPSIDFVVESIKVDASLIQFNPCSFGHLASIAACSARGFFRRTVVEWKVVVGIQSHNHALISWESNPAVTCSRKCSCRRGPTPTIGRPCGPHRRVQILLGPRCSVCEEKEVSRKRNLRGFATKSVHGIFNKSQGELRVDLVRWQF